MAKHRKFAVYWTKSAELDLDAICGYLAPENPNQAGRVFERIERTASRLAFFPRRGRIVPELREQGIYIYRELICAPWRMIYRVEGRTTWILAVIDGRRDLEDLLLERFLH